MNIWTIAPKVLQESRSSINKVEKYSAISFNLQHNILKINFNISNLTLKINIEILLILIEIESMFMFEIPPQMTSIISKILETEYMISCNLDKFFVYIIKFKRKI